MKTTVAVEHLGEKTKIISGLPDLTDFGHDNTGQQHFYSGREKTLAYKIIRAHECDLQKNSGLHIKFDALVSHDITYVGIIQTARASGLTEFPVPYALTNCHNSLCAVGGTINKDDHVFGLSAAKKYGGIFVPANHAVIHQYAREKLTGCGKMILGSDSHTRYGCYGAMGFGEGGGELVKQLLGNTYDIDPPDVVLVWLEGSPKKGVGPHDVALALIKETFHDGKVKNKILEFAGPGIKNLSMDFRSGIDVMTTETSCLSSIWETDETVLNFYNNTGRSDDYIKLTIEEGACYDSMVKIDLSAVESMIAMPFHPSKALTIHELQREPMRILQEIQNDFNEKTDSGVNLDLLRNINKDGKVTCEQGIIAGCAGGMYENISEAADILRGNPIGNGFFDISVYPASTPVSLAITRDGITETLIDSGALIKPAFCGPCFGAGDIPANNSLSVRHCTRNFTSREGSKPGSGQIASVALMDARSIAATAVNAGVLTAATDIDYSVTPRDYIYNGDVYEKRCYNGFGKSNPSVELRFGPNIADWPEFKSMEEDMLIKLCAVIHDDVTTTDELIPSGETSSYRSNPVALSEFTLSRRVPGYVAASKEVRTFDDAKIKSEVQQILKLTGGDISKTSIGSCIFAKKPGDGSAREQAASCQRVLGGLANICFEYATKRYRSNCINWGIVPFTLDKDVPFEYVSGDWIYIPGVKSTLLAGKEIFRAKVYAGNKLQDITLFCGGLNRDERIILTEGCLINHYAKLKPKL